MIKNIPKLESRSPDQIVRDMMNYDSVGHVFRALSCLDYAKRASSTGGSSTSVRLSALAL